MIPIGNREIGERNPCFVIAEAGVNHNGTLELALRLVDAAVTAGADAIKFQTFKPDALVTRGAAKAAYQSVGNSSESQHAMLAALQLSVEDHRALRDYCAERRIMFLSTPFDIVSARELLALGVPAFKISSGDLTNTPFLAELSRFGLPLILSTGMGNLDDIHAALAVVQCPVALLHCVSCYPTAPADVNLRAMDTMAETFRIPIGYSDHTPGIEVALAAVAKGAAILEKHLTLHRDLPGPDHRASLEPSVFGQLVRGIRVIEAALGDGRKEPALAESEVARVARRSLVAAVDLPSGAAITEDQIAIKRPGTGLPPAFRSSLVGRTVRRAIAADTLLTLDMFA